MRALVIVCLLAHTAAADDAAGPVWIAGPDRAYNCTHYLDAPISYKHAPQVAAGAPMALALPRDKVMKFTLSARPATKSGKVRYEVETPPPGAKLDGAKFEWKVAGTPGQKLAFALVAVEGERRTRWPIALTIATDKQFTAWSAGAGSVWPDCDVYVPNDFEVLDLDGDGKDDVIYRRYAGDDGSAEVVVRLQRGALKFVDAATCTSCGFTPEVAADNAHLLVSNTSCCCVDTLSVERLEGDHYVEAGTWSVSDNCNGGDFRTKPTIDFTRDSRNRITGVDVQQDGKTQHWKWRGHEFVLVER